MDRSTAMRVSRIAAGELQRAMRQIRVPGYPRPYYLSYLIRDEESFTISAKYGALRQCERKRERNAFADVRIGSHAYDQVRDGGLGDNGKECESYGYVELPFGGAPDAIRHGLWRLTEARYREAVEDYMEKRSRELTYRRAGGQLGAFERREPAVDLAFRPFPAVDPHYWSRFVERASARIRRYPGIKDSHVEFEADHVCRILVNSEGSRIVECHVLWSLECYLWLVSDAGDTFPWHVRHTVADPNELPDAARFDREIHEATEKLYRLARAPVLRSFAGPALLDPVPAGLLVHEALGHRLEGTRLLASGEGQTFRDSIGRRILPEFLSIRDAPRLARFDGRSLVGHYRYDDEGVPASDTCLVRDGRLEAFLGTRTKIARRHRSSGHARASYHERPISRMSVTVVEARDGLDEAGLERVLLEEIRRQKVPFGIRIVEATNGETATDAYNFQALLGEINLASKVYPDGREEWIRGVNFIGTPLNAVRSIVAAGRRTEVDNAFCGAESGYVPVSTISPALVVTELELQSKGDAPYSPDTLPIPWLEGKRGRGTRRRR